MTMPVDLFTETEGMALSETLTTLRTLTSNVEALTAQIKTLEWTIPLVVVIGITVIGIIVALKH